MMDSKFRSELRGAIAELESLRTQVETMRREVTHDVKEAYPKRQDVTVLITTVFDGVATVIADRIELTQKRLNEP